MQPVIVIGVVYLYKKSLVAKRKKTIPRGLDSLVPPLLSSSWGAGCCHGVHPWVMWLYCHIVAASNGSGGVHGCSVMWHCCHVIMKGGGVRQDMKITFVSL